MKELYANKSSKNKNTDMNSDKGDFEQEQTREDDVCNVMHVSKEKRPDRSEIAAAALARAKEEEAKKKAKKEKAEKQKELARRAEEEKIAAKKRAAAEAGEALERKDAQKDEKARAAAKTAAEGRATERGEGAATQGIVAEAATDERAAAAHGIHAAPGFSQIKEKIVNEKSEKHMSKENVENVKSGRHSAAKIHGNTKEEESLSCSPVPLKNENQERETVRTSNGKHSGRGNGEEKNSQRLSNRTAGHKEARKAEEKEIAAAGAEASEEKEARKIAEAKVAAARAAEERSVKAASLLGTHTVPGSSQNEMHGKQSGKRPKEGVNEHSSHSENSQAGQNNGRSIITIQQNENGRYKQEKEIVSVTGNERERSKESGSVKGEARRVAVAVMEDGRDGSEKSKSFRGDGQRSYSLYTELNNQKKEQDTQMEKNKQEHSHMYQNEQKSHDRGKTGDARGYSQQDKHNHRSQQQYMPPAIRDRDFQYKQNHHRHSQKRQHYVKRDEQSCNSYHSQHNTQPVQQKLALQGSRALFCGYCRMKYSLPKNVPRNLYCGHSLCTSCIDIQIYHYTGVSCPFCPVHTWYAKSAEQCPVNQPLVNILCEEIKQDAVMEENRGKGKPHFPAANVIRQSRSHPVSDSRAGSGMEQSESKSVVPRSPHGSKCMEMGVRPSSYCVTCHVWVCVKCAEAEHSTKRCSLRPLKDQLLEMKQSFEAVGKRAHELLGKFLQSLENSLDQDKSFLLWLKAAFECIEKKQEDMKNELQEGKKHMNTLVDVIESLPRAANLPEALAAFQVIDDMTGVAQHWTTDTELSVTSADKETISCLKHLMKRTLRSLQVKNGISEMFAVNKIPDGDLFSELRDEGGRFHLHALKKGKPTKQGTQQALPLQCFKSCQAADSTLVFLDLSWGGTTRGRLYIRLIGNTLRGQQFISLCTGEGSISFRGTHFHRVWAKDKPGEHVWTGDYEKGDGSGGRSLLSTSSQKQVPAGREVPISAGLVAGRFEKDISSIFRIYTREEKGGKDEAGFGQVEFGLDALKEAVRLKNIIDVMISDCGLVLEM